jgi:cyclopropane fatty-acyl-phospholipid synthase-like methyltransferase
VQLKHSYSLEKLYGENYGYRSGLNNSMIEHLKNIVKNIYKKIELRTGDLIIDIASNDGTLLRSYSNNINLKLVGIDPTAEKFKKYYPEHVSYIPNFFSSALVKEKIQQKARVITSIAMFYDLEDPMNFVKQIHDVLADDGIWVFEQSYMPEMIRKNSYDTICHEHLEYYGLKQVKWLMDKTGFKIIDVEFNNANGGSFCITVAKDGSKYKESAELVNKIVKQEEYDGFDQINIYNEFNDNILLHKKELLKFINDLREQGKVIFGYGASTKGNVILQYCGLSAKEIPYIAEVNEYKFGRLTPGSDIPIISEAEARSRKPDYFLVLPWHFRENIIKRESDFLRSGGHLLFPLPKIEIV